MTNTDIKQITDNLLEAISNLTDASKLLEQNKTTKKYLDSHNKLEDKYYSTLTLEEANDQFDIQVRYEQALSIASFLTGLKLGANIQSSLNKDDFVKNTLDMIYS